MHPDEQLAHAAVDAARRAGDPLLISAALDSVRHAVAPSGRVGEMVRAGAGRVEQAGRMSTSDPLHAPELEDLYCNSNYDQIAVGDIAAATELARIVLDNDLQGDYPHLSASAALPALALRGELKTGRAARRCDVGQLARRGIPARGVVAHRVAVRRDGTRSARRPERRRDLG
jgi:hypothetical protein